jgi:hypothetical protein
VRRGRLDANAVALAPPLLGGFDEAGEFGAGDAVSSAELDEFRDLVEEGAAFGGAGDADSVALSQFEEALVAEQSDGA